MAPLSLLLAAALAQAQSASSVLCQGTEGCLKLKKSANAAGAQAAPQEPRPANQLHGLVSLYKKGRRTCESHGSAIDPLLAKWDKEPLLFPLALVGNRLVALASKESGLDCAAGGFAAGATGCAAFAGTNECLHRAAVRYEGSSALRALTRVSGSGEPAADAIRKDVNAAVDAWRELTGGSITLADPRPAKEGWIERIADTGVGYMAPFQDQKIGALLQVELYGDKGRIPVPEDRCASERVTQAELMYAALEATEGNVTQAMGGLSGVLHDGVWGPTLDGRKVADCVNGLWRKHYKDYYRYSGLYVGLQGRKHMRYGASTVAQTQTWVYGVLKSVWDLSPATLLHTGDAKIPEFQAGLAAGDKLRADYAGR